ncbi:ferritin-like domain-containing protein [Actinopolymorpha sp. NPDC004070]|uniref:ferritin-like domain-containing protein n=1 Tax=Actinopolymorpha sp. NPDC004070 TaxID=3154548 RepID=UPI0033A0BD0B
MSDREVAGLQEALAGVHAAIWGYQVLTPQLRSDDRSRGESSIELYRELRERLRALLRSRHETPVAADAGYRLPFQVTGGSSARRLAAYLEDGCAGVFADLVAAATSSSVRTLGTDLLVDCARRRLDWGADPVAFPGVAHPPGAAPSPSGSHHVSGARSAR